MENVYSYIELNNRKHPMSRDKDILRYLTKFATENGYASWDAYLTNFLSENPSITLDPNYISAKETIITTSDYSEALRYPALRTISGIMIFAAWVVLISIILLSLLIPTIIKVEGIWVVSIVLLFIGLIAFLLLLANAETIKVFIDIERNTRKTAGNG